VRLYLWDMILNLNKKGYWIGIQGWSKSTRLIILILNTDAASRFLIIKRQFLTFFFRASSLTYAPFRKQNQWLGSENKLIQNKGWLTKIRKHWKFGIN
jgi:hypothetical protein